MVTNGLRYAVMALGCVMAGAALAEVTFYEREDFRGRSFTVTDPVPDFTRHGFNNRASSAVVRGGQYLVCDNAEFRGHCVRLGPGNYSRLTGMGLNNRITSARPTRGPGAGMPRAVLFEQPNLRGRSFPVEGNQQFHNLGGSGFDNRISSLRVERGTWQFCSGPDFSGACATFGPGDHMHLPRGLDNRISSGRLAHGNPDGTDAAEEQRLREYEAEGRRRAREARQQSRD